MLKFKDMILQARKEGKTSEQAMWDSIDDVEEIMETIYEYHPEKYWDFMRKTYENLYGPHYNEKFAEYDVKHMYHTDDKGIKHEGAHWSKQEVVNAMQGKVFPSGTTDCDKFVAANAIWHDLSNKFSDSDILDIAYLFFFCDEDSIEGKVWNYMCAM